MPGLPDVPTDGVIRQVFESVRVGVSRCLGPTRGAVAVEATITGATGEVTGVHVTGALPEDDRCIVPIIKGLRFPKFGRSSLTANYRYTF